MIYNLCGNIFTNDSYLEKNKILIWLKPHLIVAIRSTKKGKFTDKPIERGLNLLQLSFKKICKPLFYSFFMFYINRRCTINSLIKKAIKRKTYTLMFFVLVRNTFKYLHSFQKNIYQTCNKKRSSSKEQFAQKQRRRYSD